MASPTVRLTFEGDTSDLESASSRAGDATSRVADRAGDATDRISRGNDTASSSFDRLGEGADGAEGKFQGFADVVTGFGDTATAFAEGDIAGMAAGLASMAGGIAAFVVPVLGTLWAAVTSAATAVWGFTTALLASPITWIVLGIAAVVAAIVLMIVYWDDVKRVVGDVVNFVVDKWNWVKDNVVQLAQTIWTWITTKIGAAWDWVKNKAIDFWNWLSGLPGRIGSALGSVASTISAPFRAAFNFIADAWNNTIGRLSWSVPSWVPFIGGNTISVPRLPRFHTGGVVPGAMGQEVMAVLQAGERVIPANQSGAGVAATIEFSGNVDSAFASAFMKLVREGAIQVVTT